MPARSGPQPRITMLQHSRYNHRGRVCGSVALEHIVRRTDSAEIGYWVAADREGRGLVTRCVTALTAIAFEDLGLHRLEIRAAEGNRRSWAIPERLGWLYEGTARGAGMVGGQRLDMRVYSRLRSDVQRTASETGR